MTEHIYKNEPYRRYERNGKVTWKVPYDQGIFIEAGQFRAQYPQSNTPTAEQLEAHFQASQHTNQ